MMTRMHDAKPQTGHGSHPVTFTPREQDVLACIISGRSTKTMADLLCISAKTVETHIHNVMEKLGRHSRQDIVSYIEASPLLPHLKKRYRLLTMQVDFEQTLKAIGLLITSCPKPRVLMVLRLSNQAKGVTLVQALRTVGVTVLKHPDGHIDYTITISAAPSTTKETKGQDGDRPEEMTEATQAKPPPHALILLTRAGKQGFEARLSLDQHPVLLTFALLKHILPDVALDPLIVSFQQHWHDVLETEALREDDSQKAQSTPKTEPTLNITFYPWRTMISIFILIALITVYALWSTQRFPTVRSDGAIPEESYLLHRPQIMAQIDAHMKKQKGIATVVLVGIGGSGKTTLARLYARQQRLPVVWEINAETQGALLASFEALTYALSRTREEKAEWELVKNTENTQERANKLILLAQHKLKKHGSWHLVFDNVDDITALLPFLPHNSEVWGTGTLTITTRNAHIQDSLHINPQSVIIVGQLEDKEQYRLFVQTLQGASLQNTVRNVEIQSFLKYIPPFPLDVSLAAYYIKNTKITYEAYVARLQAGGKAFQDRQETLLNETRTYTNTRYTIISGALHNIMKSHPKCIDLLFLLSLIEAQDIPKDWLTALRNQDATEQLMHDMHKYSLIHSNILTDDHQVLSIHRSTQEMILQFLRQTLTPQEQAQAMDHIVEGLPQYLEPILESIALPKVRNITRHLLMMLCHPSSLNASHQGIIHIQLGRLLYAVMDSHAKDHFEAGLADLRTYYGNAPNLHRAQALSHLSILIRRSCEYEKSKQWLEESLRIYQQCPSSLPTDIAWVLLHLGKAYMRLYHYTKAQELLDQSMAIYQKANIPDKVLWVWIYRGDLYYAQGDYHKARQVYEKCRTISDQIFAYCHTAWANTRLGIAYKSLGHFSKAQPLLMQSYHAYKQHLPENQDFADWTLPHLSDVFRQLGCYNEANHYIQESLALDMKIYGQHHIQTAWNRVYLAQIYLDQHNYAQSKTLLKQSYAIYKTKSNTNDLRLAWITYHLARAHLGLQEYAEAYALFERSFEVYGQCYGKDHIECARILCDWGRLHHIMNNDTQAEKMIHQALTIYQREQHPESHKALTYLGEIYQHKACVSSLSHQEKVSLHGRAQQYFRQALAILKEAQFPKESAYFAYIHRKMKQR